MKARFGLIIITILGLLVILSGTLYLVYISQSESVFMVCSSRPFFSYVICMISSPPSTFYLLFWPIIIVPYFLSFMLVYFLNVNLVKDQQRFIANASHELRTPLSIMKSTTELALLDSRDLSKNARRTLESNIEEIDRMSIAIEKFITTPSRLDDHQRVLEI